MSPATELVSPYPPMTISRFHTTSPTMSKTMEAAKYAGIPHHHRNGHRFRGALALPLSPVPSVLTAPPPPSDRLWAQRSQPGRALSPHT
ncbi:hypothetical protein GCM10009767_02280 [Kocuria aegyptia]|uniref:Uncharacterized protein n=1 Tax=Kocuria aegyptia TaxID=330943 RepID=A0ABP4W6T3_9MICC